MNNTYHVINHFLTGTCFDIIKHHNFGIVLLAQIFKPVVAKANKSIFISDIDNFNLISRDGESGTRTHKRLLVTGFQDQLNTIMSISPLS